MDLDKEKREKEKNKTNLKIDPSVVTKPVGDVLSVLDVEWKTVITLRYGLNGEEPKSVEEVAKILGCTTDAVRSLEANALRYFYTRKKI